MATTYIPINTAMRLGSQLRTNVEQLRAAIDGLGKLRAIMATQTDGADYTLMETQFGLAQGDGKAAAFQIGAFLDAIGSNGPTASLQDKVNQLLNQLG